ncbi:MAG: galactose-1-phosphate uridylyltransferase [Sporichthyaceae bacterium]
MRRTETKLADGRELIYFDSDETAAHTDRTAISDPRDLDPVATASEIRYDEVLDEWVTIASHRQGRTHLPPADECPMCPSTPDRHTEVPAEDYDVVVFENRFPSLAEDAEPGFTEDDVHRAGRGRCEVIVFTSDHNAALSQLPPERVRLLLDAWIDRSQALAALPAVEQVFCFENRGREIGVTLSHPHGQVYGYPFVTPRTRQMVASARAYREHTGRDVDADRVAAELADGSRLVTNSEHWVAFVPFAARWPVEVHLYPQLPVPDLPALSAAARDDFPQVYLDVLRAMDGLYDAPLPYISGWHQAPVRVDRDLASLHLEVFSIKRAAGKMKFLAGSESGVGAFINDVAPERIAATLRDALPK